jgi:hypothetical protein
MYSCGSGSPVHCQGNVGDGGRRIPIEATSTTTVTDDHDEAAMTMMEEEEGQNWMSWE